MGEHRSRRPADDLHPFGYGRELYFWSFVVALLLFSGGAGVSIYEGVMHYLDPEPIRTPIANYIVLGLSALFEGGSWLVANRALRTQRRRPFGNQPVAAEQGPVRVRRPGRGQRGADRHRTGADRDLAGAVDGQSAVGRDRVDRDRRTARSSAVLLADHHQGAAHRRAGEPRPVEGDHRGCSGRARACASSPASARRIWRRQIIAIVGADFDDRLTTPQIEAHIRAIEQRVQQQYAQVTGIFVRPESSDAPTTEVEQA